MHQDKLNEVSQRSSSLNYMLKLPMLCLIAAAALISGTSILLMKIVDTILQFGDFEAYWHSILLVGVVVIFLSDT